MQGVVMNKKILLLVIALCFLVVAVTGFAASENASSPQPAPQPSPQKKEESSLSGKVLETMTSGGYTYAQIEKNGQKTWVAVPQTTITVGQEISFIPGTEMGAFESKTLKRKFDNIIFSPGISGQASKAHGTAMSGRAATEAENIRVQKAEGPNAYTIGELIANIAGLDKQKVVVRGKVVKVSEQIMGTNWIHIKDGSGKNEKLVVTSQDLPKVGDIVTASGTLHKDKDFGSGYKYAVILENAAVK
jgi:hypothetical protein